MGLRLLGGRGRRRRRGKILFEREPSRGPEGKIDDLRERGGRGRGREKERGKEREGEGLTDLWANDPADSPSRETKDFCQSVDDDDRILVSNEL